MEIRAPYIVIGAFVLSAIVAVFGFVYWLNNVGGIGKRESYQLVFTDPVPGPWLAQAFSSTVSALARSQTLSWFQNARARFPPRSRSPSARRCIATRVSVLISRE